jgi:hypothetical protein
VSDNNFNNPFVTDGYALDSVTQAKKPKLHFNSGDTLFSKYIPEVQDYPNPAIINADTLDFWFDSSFNALSKTTQNFIDSPVVGNYFFVNVYDPNNIKNWLMYTAPISGSCYVKTMKYTKNISTRTLPAGLPASL